MFSFLLTAALIVSASIAQVQASAYPALGLHNDNQAGLSINGVPATTRNKWMRIALDAVKEIRGDPCSHFPFGVAVVNTTSDELVCVAANAVGVTGNPSMHGEITGLARCTEMLTEQGKTPQEILASWKHYTMYTTGEPCPMCASALRWAGMGEVVWATSIETIILGGRNQIYIPSSMIVSASYSLPSHTLWLGSVLANETDPYFQQYNETAPCPAECHRVLPAGQRVTTCVPRPEWTEEWKKTEGEWEKELMRTKGHPAKSVGGHDEL